MRRSRLVQPLAVARPEQPLELGVADERHVEGRGDRGQRDVVVRRADPARGEDDVEAGGEGAHALGDLGSDVGDDLDAPQRHPQRAQLADQELGVLVLDLPRQELVADEQDRRRRFRAHAGHSSRGPS